MPPASSRSSAGTAAIRRASCAWPSPGLLVIGYRSNPSPIEMAADKFNQYLKEEGLDAVLAMRASRNETGAAAHELFSRCAKSLVFSGTPAEAQGDRAARVSRSSSSPSAIRTPSRRVRIFPFACSTRTVRSRARSSWP